MHIKNSNIILLLPGNSLNQITLFMPIDNVLYASLNRFSHIEKDFLIPHGKKIDLLWISSAVRFEEEKLNVAKYLTRGNILFTSHQMYLQHGGFFRQFQNQIVCSSEGIGLCSLFTFLAVLISNEPKRIILVGADGEADLTVYYNDLKLQNEDLEARRKTILRDTKILNKIFWDCIEAWYPPTKTQVINVNPKSAYTVFAHQSLKDVCAEIQSEK